MRSFLAVIVGYGVFVLPAVVLFRFTPGGPVEPTFMVVATLYGMFFAFLGGLIARRVARRRDARAGTAVAILIAAGAIGSLIAEPHGDGVWSALAALVLMAPAAFFGGKRSRRKRATA
jgi:hypothetical protein